MQRRIKIKTMPKKNNGSAKGIIIGIILIAVLFFGYMAISQTGGQEGGSTDPTQCADSTGILTVNSLSAIVGGTAPSSPTVTAGIDGGAVAKAVTSGTTTFPVGAEVEVLVSKADYIDRSYTFTMPCGGYTLDAKLFQSTSDNPSITIKDADGDTVTDAIAGGANNLTVVGSTVEGSVKFVGTAFESSGKGIYVIEFPAGSDANISTVSLGSLNEVAKPKIYTTLNAGSKVVAFEVPAVEGGVVKEYDLLITLEGGKTLTGGIYTDWFGGQEFIDDDLTISEGVEDSDGTAKYENTLDYDAYVSA